MWYSNGMITTIDKAGRVVIPAELRRKARLTPGTALAIDFEDGAIRITREADPPQLERRKGRLLAKPRSSDGPEIDVAALVREERSRWPL